MSSTSIRLVINNFVDYEVLSGDIVVFPTFVSLYALLRIFFGPVVSRSLVFWLPTILRHFFSVVS